MKVEIKVPAMGESISEAIVGDLIKKSGSKVSTDDEILELETDKVNQVLYAPDSGVLTLDVNIDDTVKIGQVIGHVDTEGKAEEKEEKPEKKEEPKKRRTAKKEEEPERHPKPRSRFYLRNYRRKSLSGPNAKRREGNAKTDVENSQSDCQPPCRGQVLDGYADHFQ